MTDEEIDKMEPGRELNMLVAEHVMGWRWRVWRTKPSGHPAYKTLCPPTDSNPWNYEGQPSPLGARVAASQQEPPRFSRDIAAAWLVVEKLKERSCKVMIDDGSDYAWNCYFEDRGFKDGNGAADTAPLAICRAALKCCKAVAGKKEGAWEAPSYNEPNVDLT